MHGVDESRVKLWIEALRSREFRQANGFLETVLDLGEEAGEIKGNCCLGVAMHVALRNGWEPELESGESLDWGPASMNMGAAAWFGFRDGSEPWTMNTATDPYLGKHEVPDAEDPYGVRKTDVYCVEANDDLNWDFERIAKALEDRYITLEPAIEGES